MINLLFIHYTVYLLVATITYSSINSDNSTFISIHLQQRYNPFKSKLYKPFRFNYIQIAFRVYKEVIIMKRDAYFDNARVVLIFLVVFGHLIQPYTNTSVGTQTLYTWIYTFHMPAFILISGYFAKGRADMSFIKNLIKKLLLPYLIFQLLYTVYYYLLGKSNFDNNLFEPQWSLWFLLSLFSFHLLLIIFKQVPVIVSLGIAITIGLLTGYINDVGHAYSLSRTLVFFPFFLAGYFLTQAHIDFLQNKLVQLLGISTMIIIALAIYIAPDINSGWLFASKSYNDLGRPITGIFARSLIYLTSTLMTFSILSLIPKKEYAFTYIGQRTLYIYLIHGFIIQFLREMNLITLTAPLQLIHLLIITIVIMYLLSHKYTMTVFEPVVELQLK